MASIDADRPARFALREFAELSSWLLFTLLGPRHEAAIGSVAQGLLRHQARGTAAHARTGGVAHTPQHS